MLNLKIEESGTIIKKKNGRQAKFFTNTVAFGLRLEGVDAQISDANIIMSGVNQLLSVVNFQNRYNPEYAVRVVNQNVVVQQ